VAGWARIAFIYSCAIILIAILIVTPLSSSVAESDIKVKATMNKQGKIAVRVLNNSGQDIYALQIMTASDLSNAKGGKGWRIDLQSDPHGTFISFVTDSAQIKNGIQKKFYVYYEGTEKSINLTWVAKGKGGEKILQGSVKVVNRYEGMIEVTTKPIETAFDLIIDNKSFKNVGTVGLAIWAPIGETFIENVTAPVGWSYQERELVTEEGAFFNGILIIPDEEEDFIIPNSKNSFKIDLSYGYADYCVWLVSYTLFDTNDPNEQKVIKNDFLTLQNPSCSI